MLSPPSYPRGAEWRRWDLHVHTPASIVQHYGKGKKDPWEGFLDDLRSLPSDIAVLGINDYLLVDGYQRVREEHQAGNLPNIAAVFPVVELRLENLVGAGGSIQKINYHVIFDPSLTAEVIEAQFLGGLSADVTLASSAGSATGWSGYISRGNLEAFGEAIRESVPEHERSRFRESNLELGFNNLCVSKAALTKCLANSALAGRFVTAIGKTEWSALKWGDASIAVKKDLLEGTDIVFTAAENPAAYHKSRRALQKDGVNDRLFDCSDAHWPSSATDKDRLGNCFTWVNADPTLHGLKHAITEFETRVHVGDPPPRHVSVRTRPADFIREVEIAPTDAGEAEPFFNASVPLNPGFVAIVGNKGNGKSALADILGLAGSSRNEESFSFLTEERFRAPLSGPAKRYKATVHWHSGESSTCNLAEQGSADSLERVTYLPQRLIDTICSSDPGPASARFSMELESVLFSHVEPQDRLGARSLRELIELKAASAHREISRLRRDLAKVNGKVAALEATLFAGTESTVKGQVAELKTRLQEHDAAKPAEEAKQPLGDDGETTSEELAKMELELEKVEKQIDDARAASLEVGRRLEALKHLKRGVRDFQRVYEEFLRDHAEYGAALGVELGDVVEVAVDVAGLEAMEDLARSESGALAGRLDADVQGSLIQSREALLARLHDLRDQLDAPARAQEALKAMLAEWNGVRDAILNGSSEGPGIKQMEERLAEVRRIPGELNELRVRRLEISGEIYNALREVVDIFDALYVPARRFIAQHPLAAECGLTFGTTLRVEGLMTRFFELVHRGASGTFSGVADGEAVLRDLIAQTDFEDAGSVQAFVTELHDAMHEDGRGSKKRLNPAAQLRKAAKVQELYDLIFGLEYLEPHYFLERDGTPLDRLSPGEKGTLLLMFYLLVDRARRPLVLDQPDENLDNQTIKDLLVPAIKEASRERQVIVVTHNPNVAVVADADQIVEASFDGVTFAYRSGSLHEIGMNTAVVDVLEGTWPAFINRQDKYQQESQRPSDGAV